MIDLIDRLDRYSASVNLEFWNQLLLALKLHNLVIILRTLAWGHGKSYQCQRSRNAGRSIAPRCKFESWESKLRYKIDKPGEHWISQDVQPPWFDSFMSQFDIWPFFKTSTLSHKCTWPHWKRTRQTTSWYPMVIGLIQAEAKLLKPSWRVSYLRKQ